MTPNAFDVYMGAIGEESFKAVMQNLEHSGVHTFDLPEAQFEKFDLVLTLKSNKKTVFVVDLKNFNLDSHDSKSLEYQTQKTCEKIKELKEDDVFKGKRVVGVLCNTVLPESEEATMTTCTESMAQTCELDKIDLIMLNGYLNQDGEIQCILGNFLQLCRGLK